MEIKNKVVCQICPFTSACFLYNKEKRWERTKRGLTTVFSTCPLIPLVSTSNPNMR